MNFCTFQLPTHRSLSEEIVGTVLQRKRYESRGYPESEDCRAPRFVKISTSPGLSVPERDAVAVIGLLSLTNGVKRSRSDYTNFASRKVRCGAAAETRQQSATELNSKQEPIGRKWYQPLKQIADGSTYGTNHFQKQTDRLRETIETVERQRRVNSIALPAEKNGWDVAVSYFNHFRFGLQARGRSATVRISHAQVDFLNQSMSSDVVLNTGQGHEAMLRNWKCISLWFQDVEVELQGLDTSAVGALIAITETRVTITERTLRNLFPRLCRNQDTSVGLAERLLGRRIAMRGLTHFEWDQAACRFTSVKANSDLYTPLLHLLGNEKDVFRAFENASISPDFQWKAIV